MKQQYGLYGEYKHSVDSKNRVTLPTAIRNEFSADEDLIITAGFDKALSIYPNAVWIEMLENAGSGGPGTETRKLRRFFAARASRLSLDSQGRIVVPDRLLEWAGIEKHVTVVGNYNTVELWQPENWEAYQEDVDLEEAAEKLFDSST